VLLLLSIMLYNKELFFFTEMKEKIV